MPRLVALSLCLLTLCAPAAAEMGVYGWGPRLGAADEPDQILIGIHQDLAEIVDDLRLQPSLDLGFGGDHTLVSRVPPVHHRFPGDSVTPPYLGGGLFVAWIDRDTPRAAATTPTSRSTRSSPAVSNGKHVGQPTSSSRSSSREATCRRQAPRGLDAPRLLEVDRVCEGHGRDVALEATVGIEPTYEGFADPCLTTWLRRPEKN